ncbi:hypothetical protein ES332_A05G379000v1 [Gossypium tomentosum]|uniref:Uncharacterized protein n=1 Tax=Gossypium tomentosum TaxID=34277 RepID=A0A5D2QQD7_GOSTO|nr:hypothetical protein ES332_A05G379000v1 [Gossypium tomentosum]
MWLMIIPDHKTDLFEFLPTIPEQDFFVWLWKVTLKFILIKGDSGGIHSSNSTLLAVASPHQTNLSSYGCRERGMHKIRSTSSFENILVICSSLHYLNVGSINSDTIVSERLLTNLRIL